MCGVPVRRLVATVAALGCAVAVQSCAPVRRDPAPARPSSTPTAGPDRDLPAYATVGALFRPGSTNTHSCTASVIASATGDTVITAAHCVRGNAAGMSFVPDYRMGASRFGAWRVTGAYVPPGWQRDQDPQADYAVLTVAPHFEDGHRVDLAAVTGSELLGQAPAVGSAVTVVAYNNGRNDVPVVCHTKVYVDHGFPTFDCHGFIAGSSGSPWLSIGAHGQPVVEGVIGGLHQGGCFEFRSHTSAFTTDVRILVHRAEADLHPDDVVAAGDDGC